MLWFLFTILSALLWATSNFLDKYLATRLLHPLAINVVGSLLAGIAGMVILVVRPEVISVRELVAGLTVGVLGFLAIAPYLLALRYEETSRVVPLWSFTALFVPFLGFLFLGQPLTGRIIIAAVLVIAGTLLLQSDAPRGLISRKPIVLGLMILGSLTWAVGVIIAETYVEGISPLTLTAWAEIGSAGTAIVLLLFMRRHLFAGLGRARALLGIAVTTLTDVLATIARFIALALTLAATVEIAATSQYLFVFLGGLLLGRIAPVLKEKTDRATIGTKLIGLMLIIAGVALVALA